MEFITNVLTVVWALRWLLAAAAFVLMALLYADALNDLKTQSREIARLRKIVADRDESVRRLRLLATAQRQRNRRQVPILAGRVIR